MDLPTKVMIYSDFPEIKNMQGNLISISEHGYYQVQVQIKEKRHTYLLPIAGTALVFLDSLLDVAPGFEVER